jgi:septum formation protein
MVEHVVLASGSPRRGQLLHLLGVAFMVDVSAIDEDLERPGDPEERARELALAKAQEVARRHPRAVVLAADTLISFRGRLLGKPRDVDEARDMLHALRGHWHRVVTGVAVLDGATGQSHVSAETTRVLMRGYTDDETAAYVASGDPMDKAAAYAIQNGDFHPVEKIDVCYTNVMGLPLCTASELLVRAGVQVAQAGADRRTGNCSLCSQARALARGR